MRVWIALVSWALASAVVSAHGIFHSTAVSEARVVQFCHDDGDVFSNESYEIYRPGETTPFQTGRTDALGRAVFVPDGGGEWRVRALSEDGHGADFRFAVEAAATAPRTPAAADRWSRASLSLGIILALFGCVSLLKARRRAE
jgi:nickel transport protein